MKNKKQNSNKTKDVYYYLSDYQALNFVSHHLLPEEERARPLDVPLAVALDAGLEDEGVGVEVVVRGDRAVLAAAAGVLHHHRHRQGDAAKVLWTVREQDGRRRNIWSSELQAR